MKCSNAILQDLTTCFLKHSNATLQDLTPISRHEGRTAASERLGEALAKLDAANLPSLTDEEIAAEIAAARQERTARRA